MIKSFASIYHGCKKYTPVRDLNSKYEVLSTIKVDFEGRQVSRSSYVVDDPAHRYDGIKPSDFCLENQLIVGVKPNMIMCSLQRGEIESQIERANNISNEN